MDQRRKREIELRRKQIARLVEEKTVEINRLDRERENLYAEDGELWEELRAGTVGVE